MRKNLRRRSRVRGHKGFLVSKKRWRGVYYNTAGCYCRRCNNEMSGRQKKVPASARKTVKVIAAPPGKASSNLR